MAEPPDQMPAAAGRGHLRASHADREHAIETLKAAYVRGMLTKDELDARLGQALTSRTCADLAAVTVGLPAGLAAAKPPQPARAQGRQPVLRPGPAITATVLYLGVWVYAILFPKGGDNDTDGELIVFGGLLYFMILAICVGRMAERRSRGQSARRSTPASG